jgi:hypothetical protein
MPFSAVTLRANGRKKVSWSIDVLAHPGDKPFVRSGSHGNILAAHRSGSPLTAEYGVLNRTQKRHHDFFRTQVPSSGCSKDWFMSRIESRLKRLEELIATRYPPSDRTMRPFPSLVGLSPMKQSAVCIRHLNAHLQSLPRSDNDNRMLAVFQMWYWALTMKDELRKISKEDGVELLKDASVKSALKILMRLKKQLRESVNWAKAREARVIEERRENLNR